MNLTISEVLSMEEMLKQILEQLNSMREEMKTMNQRIDNLEQEQRITRLEMHQSFKEVKEELRIIREQTARNSELEAEVNTNKNDIEDLKTDVKMIKRIITNQ